MEEINKSVLDGSNEEAIRRLNEMIKELEKQEESWPLHEGDIFILKLLDINSADIGNAALKLRWESKGLSRENMKRKIWCCSSTNTQNCVIWKKEWNKTKLILKLQRDTITQNIVNSIGGVLW